jgi:hypothetical protein
MGEEDLIAYNLLSPHIKGSDQAHLLNANRLVVFIYLFIYFCNSNFIIEITIIIIIIIKNERTSR